MGKTKAELIQENKELKAKLEGFRSANKRLQTRLQTTLDDNEDLQHKVKGLKATMAVMQREGDELYREKLKLTEDILELQQEGEDLEENLTILQSQIKHLQLDEETLIRQTTERVQRECQRRLDQEHETNMAEIDRLIDHIDQLEWLIKMLHQSYRLSQNDFYKEA